MNQAQPEPRGDLIREQARSSLRYVWRVLQVVAALLVLGYLGSGIRSVRPNEIGLQIRFGRVVRDDLKPGLHVTAPWPIDRIVRVPVKTVERMVVDDFSASLTTASASGQFYKRTGLESYCVTGDNNLVHATLTLQYVIAEPVGYRYRTADHDALLRLLASNALTHAIASRPVDEVLTTAKGDIEADVRLWLATDLDELGSGIGIASVTLSQVAPPRKVQRHFDDVVNAQLESQKLINQAESYRNSQIPKANGQASRLHQEAQAYRQKQIRHAEGEADRFVAQLVEYHKARRISRQRLYLDFVERVYPKLYSKVVVGEERGQPVGEVRLHGQRGASAKK